MKKKKTIEKIEDQIKNDQLPVYLKQKEANRSKIKCRHCQNRDFNLELSCNLILIQCSSCKNIIGDLFSFHYLLAQGKKNELEIYEQELELEKMKNNNLSDLFLAEYHSLKCALKPTLKVNYEQQKIENGYDFEDLLIKKLGWKKVFNYPQNSPDFIDPEGNSYFLVKDPETQKLKLQLKKEK